MFTIIFDDCVHIFRPGSVCFLIEGSASDFIGNDSGIWALELELGS
jgi:hypothetical protein